MHRPGSTSNRLHRRLTRRLDGATNTPQPHAPHTHTHTVALARTTTQDGAHTHNALSGSRCMGQCAADSAGATCPGPTGASCCRAPPNAVHVSRQPRSLPRNSSAIDLREVGAHPPLHIVTVEQYSVNAVWRHLVAPGSHASATPRQQARVSKTSRAAPSAAVLPQPRQIACA